MAARYHGLRWLGWLAAGAVALGACDAEPGAPGESPLPFASELISFDPGEGAGFGADALPGVVLGPPRGAGELAGSLDVLSLGIGGEVVVGFGDRELVDGPGVDLIVYENAFYVGGNPELPFVELGAVAVSDDGETWHEYPCAVQADGDGAYPGCAGWHVIYAFEAKDIEPLDPDITGGDAFDLEDLGVDAIRYVRVRDISGGGIQPMAGFDLDAVGGVYLE